jgi:preprotein translocase subunit SecG
MAWYHYILATLFGFVAIILMGVILLQRGKGVGLSGAFGGAGGHTAFGAKTGDVLTWATIVVAAVLLTFTVILNYVFVPPTPFATPAPPPPVSPVVPSAPPTETPVKVPDETTAPATPVETAPPTETGSPQEKEAPDKPRETPEGAWNPDERTAWPPYARQDNRGAALG